MKHNIIYFIIILISLNSCGFSQKGYKHIPRTRVSIKIPSGYKIMNTITGLQNSKSEMIMIVDMVGNDFYTSTKNFTKDKFGMQGITVYDFYDTIVSGFDAKIMVANSDDIKFNSISLVFGDTTFSTMINSIHNSNDKQLENKIKETLLSIKYNKNKEINPYENIFFSIDTTSTSFKLQGFSGNTYFFMPFGKDTSKNKSLIILTPQPFDKSMSLNSISRTFTNSMVKYGTYGFVTDSTSRYKNKKTDVLLKIGDCYVGVDRKYFYQLIMSKDDLCLYAFGMCDYENLLLKKEIQKFCEKIKIIN